MKEAEKRGIEESERFERRVKELEILVEEKEKECIEGLVEIEHVKKEGDKKVD